MLKKEHRCSKKPRGGEGLKTACQILAMGSVKGRDSEDMSPEHLPRSPPRRRLYCIVEIYHLVWGAQNWPSVPRSYQSDTCLTASTFLENGDYKHTGLASYQGSIIVPAMEKRTH